MAPSGGSHLARKVILTILGLLLIPVVGCVGSILGMMFGSGSGPNGLAIGGLVYGGGVGILLAIFLIILIWFPRAKDRSR